MKGRVTSVNVGQPRKVTWQGKESRTSIVKQPVSGRAAVRGVNVVGDEQADPEHHGGPDQALYAYSAEDYAWWAEQLGRPLEPGCFGENLTLWGVDVGSALLGERWQVGGIEVAVTGPRIPCYKLAWRLGDVGFPRWFARASRPGAYLRIVREGNVAAGDPVEVVDRPAHDVTVAALSDSYHGDRAVAARLLELDEASAGWKAWARKGSW